MTGRAASSLAGLIDALCRAPWTFGLWALLRRIDAADSGLPPLGQAIRPQQEPLRLGQAAALTFAPREIADAFPPGTAGSRAGNNPALPLVRVYSLGLLGPHGPLPLHVTDMVRERSENHGDATLADFLDLFHHRHLLHMYRAWAQAQAAAGLDRAQDEVFSRYVARLTGHDPLEIRDSVLPSHARLAASAHLSREARSPDALCATVARFFGVPVRMEEFALHWIRIDEADRSHLGLARASSVMGEGAIAGEFVADRQARFRLVLGPLSLRQYLRFTPPGPDLPLLAEWVRAFVGLEFAWELELRVRNDHTPPARLDEAQRLGWSTWLGGAPARDMAGWTMGMVFDPEDCIAAPPRARAGAAA